MTVYGVKVVSLFYVVQHTRSKEQAALLLAQ